MLNTLPEIDITTQEGYMARFWELVSQNNFSRSPMRDALISLESELLTIHGVRRYATYNSFSVVKMRKPQTARLKPFQNSLT